MKEQSENNGLSNKFEDFSYPVDDTNWDAIAARIPSSGGGFLGDKFATHSVEPSAGVWRGIKATIKPASRKRAGAWWWYGAAAAVFLFGYLAFRQYSGSISQIHLAQGQEKSVTSPASNAERIHSDTASIGTATATVQLEKNVDSSSALSAKANTTKSTTKLPVKSESESRPANDIFGKSKLQGEGVLADAEPLTDRQESNAIAESGFSGNRNPQKINLIKDGEVDMPVLTAALAGEMIALEPLNLDIDHKSQKSSKFYDGTETVSENQFAILAGSQLAFAGNGEMNDAATNYSEISSGLAPNEGTGSYDSAIPTSVDYSTPVYYGVNGEIKFLKRFAAGIGLGYLRMLSTADVYYDFQSKVRESESKYLSVPVYIKFNFVNKPKFAAYATVGNAIDFLIWQNTTETHTNGQFTEGHSVSGGEKGNQANLYTGLGVSYKFTRHLGIFTEGSLMRYYSITGTNFYSQQDLWPGMRFGALVSF